MNQTHRPELVSLIPRTPKTTGMYHQQQQHSLHTSLSLSLSPPSPPLLYITTKPDVNEGKNRRYLLEISKKKRKKK
jgi:hypothetical protein